MKAQYISSWVNLAADGLRRWSVTMENNYHHLELPTPTGCATCMTFCMDYLPHDRLVHPTSYSSKQAALKSKEASEKEASETIEWEQIPRHPTVN